jgi:response regulator RpfG family c-di-GMP phosphodiesterase
VAARRRSRSAFEAGPDFARHFDAWTGRLEILEGVKKSPQLKAIPVIMLTSTDHPREIQRSYEFGASAYIVKPVDFERLHDKVKTLGFFVQIIEVAA